jgi:hypothetical protein
MTPKSIVETHVLLCLTQVINRLIEVSDGEEHQILDISTKQDFKSAAEDNGWSEGCDDPDHPVALFQNQSGETSYAEGFQALCEEQGIDPYTDEAMEFWAVSDNLARALTLQGEKVGQDIYGMNVWARYCSGQAIYMDNVIEVIADQWAK